MNSCQDIQTINPSQSLLATVQKSLGPDQLLICADHDPHFSEVPAPHFRLRSQISGFHGSFGILVISKTAAMLWTDSRYYLAAKEVLQNSSIQLTLTQNSDPTASIVDWIRTHSLPTAEILILHPSVQQLREYTPLLEPRKLCPLDNLSVLNNAAPSFSHPVFFLPSDGTSSLDTLKKELHADWIFISKLEDIAWLLNIRGSDIPYYPLVISFLLIGKSATRWYLHNPQRLNRKLLPDITICEYEDVARDLKAIPTDERLLFDPSCTSATFIKDLSCSLAEHTLPIPRSIKSAQLQEHMRQCHIRDGVAMTEFLFWIYHHWDTQQISEHDAARKLRELRQKQKGFLSESFASICAVGAHAASPHYHSPEHDNTRVKDLFLFDSGAHYLDGTTDITRSIFLGTPPVDIQTDYTLVLKAHISLAKVHFPQGTTDLQLDAICRSALWTEKRDFNHGTGHGIGYVTNVHESPPRLSQSTDPSLMEEGMIFSNEPGLYREGQYGIRLENIMLVRAAHRGFHDLETLSLCPFDSALILPELLCREEQQWLQEYHKRVHQTLSPLLSKPCRNWLNTQIAL